MSMAEAQIDNIEREFDPNYGSRGRKGSYIYKIPCAKCGKIIKRTCYTRSVIYLCDYCKSKIRKKKKLSQELLGTETPKERQFIKATDKIRKQVHNYESYNNAIKIAKTKEELYGSIPETMVAIELLRLGYRIIPQQKIKRYKVDFAIPKEKIIVEVDGALYHQGNFNHEREAIIRLSLGLDWKIIHIPAEYIEKNIQNLKKIMECQK